MSGKKTLSLFQTYVPVISSSHFSSGKAASRLLAETLGFRLCANRFRQNMLVSV